MFYHIRMWPLGVLQLSVLIVIGFIHYFVYRWRNPRCNGKLPPGSMGLPIIGETLEIFARSKSIDIHPFIKSRTCKYGQVFKTSLAGRPVVICTDPEFSHYILQKEGTLVEMWYMDSFVKIMDVRGMGRDGEASPITSIGYIHKCFRNMVLGQVGSGAIQDRILPCIEETCRKTLLAWSNRDSFDIKKESSSVLFDFSAKHLYGLEMDGDIGEIYSSITQGLMSFPLNIPGTVYHNCLKKRDIGLKLMKKLLNERQSSPNKDRGDLLDKIINLMKTESETFLTEKFATFAMFAILYASAEPISSTLTLAVKLLAQHPHVVKELENEHEELIRKLEKEDDKVSWKEYKSMEFTMQVVDEVLRMSNIISGILRRSITDVQYGDNFNMINWDKLLFLGYTIPKGWTILIPQISVHLNHELYEDPLSFNPWRWKDLDQSFLAKNFIPFGGGGRKCAGAEYAKAFIAMFLHVLVSKYRFKIVKGGDITRSPFLWFEDGLYINIRSKD